MNEYKFEVNFEKGKIKTDLKKLVQNDHNSTKLNFTFDKEGKVLFKLLFPDGATTYIKEIENNELVLGAGILTHEGDYEIELSLYSNDGRLTDYATKSFFVRKELINCDEEVEVDDRLPILDQLINETNSLNVKAERVTNGVEIEVIKKDGTSEVVVVQDGAKGEQGIQGERGERGERGEQGVQGIQGLKGETGEQGPKGDKGDTGETGTPGRDGADGFSPIANVSKEDNKVIISITDKEGTTTAEVKNGIDETVDNLVNYYLKAETYTKDEVQELISVIKSIQIEVVENLPEVGESNKIYLVPKDGEENDVYNEYVWINNKYELIGNTEIDLSNYATKDDLKSHVGPIDLNTIQDFVDLWVDEDAFIIEKLDEKAERTELNKKQDVLIPGENITIENNVISAVGSESIYLGNTAEYTQDNPLDLTNLKIGKYILNYNNTFQQPMMYFKVDYMGKELRTTFSFNSMEKDYFPIIINITKELIEESTGRNYIGNISYIQFSESASDYHITKQSYNIEVAETYLSMSSGYSTSLKPVGIYNTQTISGKKTFTTLPESEVVPTIDNQLVNKKYVDDSVSTKQDTLTAGENITIEDNVISAIGGGSSSGGGVYLVNGTSSNPFVFEGKEVGTYLIENPKSTFYMKGSNESKSTRTLSQYITTIYIYKKYDDVEVNEEFAYCVYFNTSGGYYYEKFKKTTDNTGMNGIGNTLPGNLLLGNQTIGGEKTFSVTPRCTNVPTADAQLTNKKYVDDAIASAITTTLEGEY